MTAAATSVRSKARFGVLALISIGTMIDDLDRTVRGIAVPTLRADLGIDAVTMGLVFSGVLSYIVPLGDIRRIEFDPEHAL